MAAYQTLTSLRTTMPDPTGLLAAVRAAVSADVGAIVLDTQHYRLKKATAWLPADIAAAQTAIDTAAATTARLTSQHTIDQWPLETQALVLALIDQLNVLRAALPTPLAAITPAQALAAIRAKAGTL